MNKKTELMAGLVGLAIGIFIGTLLKDVGNKDELNNLRIQNSFLHDYKKAYLEHVEMCDSLHEKCFRAKP